MASGSVSLDEIDERLLTEQVRERLLRGESIEDLIRSEGDAL